VTLFRCVEDGGELVPATADRVLVNTTVACAQCGSTRHVTDGVLDLLDAGTLNPESRRELGVRERQWAADTLRPLTEVDRAEMDPHLEALALRPEHCVLEFGCGSGRFTRELQMSGARIVAVDFSKEALASIAQWAGENVALVRADVAHVRLSPSAFDRVLSTVTSNLPTAGLRENLFRAVAAGLAPNGRFVCGAHYYGLRARMGGIPRSGFYKESGIYRLFMTRADLHNEMSPWFGRLHLQPVKILPPFGRRMGMPLLRTSRACERLPVAREFGEILMAISEQPRRPGGVTA
jgi:SAM-dependent methyltransferase